MKNLAIARRYAKALLAIGKEDNQAEAYKDELAEFVVTLEEDGSGLKQALTNPLYPAEGRKKVLQGVLGKMYLSNVMNSFLYLVFDKDRISSLKDISELYEKLTDELTNIARAMVSSAVELSSEAEEKIREALSKMTGKKVILDVQTNPALIGGIVTRMGDLVFDGSISTQLSTINDVFKRGEKV
ncbi:MAG: ATP synthase F1 subunit delta [Desulfobacterales bacterium C00003106]|nr:MAG: ATP synthase F1 subunit delta [Desulfobacterales bacterium C00003106]OEU59963.1 MAG: ATP synthase F1 subunit delta [Desulfobacterales bacterium C00003104]